MYIIYIYVRMCHTCLYVRVMVYASSSANNMKLTAYMYNHLNILEFSHDLKLVFNQCSNGFCTKTSQNQNFSGSFGASNHNGISVVSLDHGTMRVF